MTTTSTWILNWVKLIPLAFVLSCASTPQKVQAIESTDQASRCMGMMPMRGQGRAPMMGGWHPASPYGQLYFRGTQVTLSGEVKHIGYVVPRPSMMQGIEIRLKTNEGEKTIHLGPTWYLEQQDFQLKMGDKVIVHARWIADGQNSFAVAEKIQKGDETLQLRDENGFPLWAGSRARGTPPPEPKTGKK